MNNQNQTIRTFNRFELKYMITIAQAARFKIIVTGISHPGPAWLRRWDI